MCYDEGMIQAYIDLELSPEESKEVCKHLKICEKCRRKYDEMSALDAFVEEKLAVEEKAFNFLCKDEAWDRFTRRPAKNSIEKGVFYMINRYKKIAAGAAAAVLISSIIWVAPVRNAAADFLSIFRVSKFKAVTFTSDDLARIKEQLEEKGMKNIDLKQYGRVKVEGGGLSRELKFEEGSSSDEVLKSALKSIEDDMGINIALPEVPEGFRLTNIRVSNPARIEITPNVKNLNQLISTFGGTKFFPEVLDGKTFAISIKNDVVLCYESSLKRGGVTQWITIQETESPDIHVPDNVNLEVVRDAVVSLPFMPENIRQQLVDIKDWKNTLPVPVGDDTDVRNITVNGSQGVFISTRHSNSAVWSDGKFMYWINTSLPEEQVLQIAESLR